ncbi:MAG TPA: sugar transferase, partial [Acidimicrobiales bacterium]|nr:sugar transferase [Acidimicrobiales bacterium]
MSTGEYLASILVFDGGAASAPTAAGARGWRGKRALDVAGALLLVLVFLPVMVLTALAVKLTSRGPVFFRQNR